MLARRAPATKTRSVIKRNEPQQATRSSRAFHHRAAASRSHAGATAWNGSPPTRPRPTPKLVGYKNPRPRARRRPAGKATRNEGTCRAS
jgi:hypothetical protein